jgi:hypothetical protein
LFHSIASSSDAPRASSTMEIIDQWHTGPDLTGAVNYASAPWPTDAVLQPHRSTTEGLLAEENRRLWADLRRVEAEKAELRRLVGRLVVLVKGLGERNRLLLVALQTIFDLGHHQPPEANLLPRN